MRRRVIVAGAALAFAGLGAGIGLASASDRPVPADGRQATERSVPAAAPAVLGATHSQPGPAPTPGQEPVPRQEPAPPQEATAPQESTPPISTSPTTTAALPSAPVETAPTTTSTVPPAPPSVGIAFPSAGAVYGAARWEHGCAGAICGTASDPAGVANVLVSVEQLSTGKYWDGHSFSAPALALLAASGTTAWRYPIGVPPDGAYRVYVGATDRNGVTTTTSSLLSLWFDIDTTPPPPPSFTATPDQSTTATDALFAFTGGAGVAFSCSLDGGPGDPCTTSSGQGQADYNSIRPGGHCFRVTATDPAGNTSSPATYCWTVTEPQGPPAEGGATYQPSSAVASR